MRSRWNCLVVGSCNVFGLALLVLSATGGGSVVRAEDPAALPGSVLEKIAAGIEQRVADLQASVAAFADSFTARRIAAQEICVGDGSGAQTCITKVQLDALLRATMQTGQVPAAIEPDQTEQTASADESVAPLALVVPLSETPAAAESLVAPLQAGEGRGGEAAEALPEVAAAPEAVTQPEGAPVPEAAALPEVAAAPEAAALPEVAAAPEVAPVPDAATLPEVAAVPEAEAAPQAAAAHEVEAVPEAVAAIPSATEPTTGQPAATSSEIGAPLAAEAIDPAHPSEPAESITAASANSQPIITEEPAVKDEDPAQRGSMETTSAPPEVKAAPAEAAPVLQGAE